MNQTIESLQVRIHLLTQRDPIGNKRIINKLQRKIRMLEKTQNAGQE